MSIITIQPKSITTNFNWHVNYGDLDIEAYDANINFLGSGGLNYIILNSQNNNFIRTASAGIEMYTNAGWDNRRMIRLVELKGMINNETKTFYSKSYSNRKYSKGEEFYEYFSWQFGFKEENILIEDLTLYIHTNAQSVSDDCGVKINYGNIILKGEKYLGSSQLNCQLSQDYRDINISFNIDVPRLITKATLFNENKQLNGTITNSNNLSYNIVFSANELDNIEMFDLGGSGITFSSGFFDSNEYIYQTIAFSPGVIRLRKISDYFTFIPTNNIYKSETIPAFYANYENNLLINFKDVAYRLESNYDFYLSEGNEDNKSIAFTPLERPILRIFETNDSLNPILTIDLFEQINYWTEFLPIPNFIDSNFISWAEVTEDNDNKLLNFLHPSGLGPFRTPFLGTTLDSEFYLFYNFCNIENSEIIYYLQKKVKLNNLNDSVVLEPLSHFDQYCYFLRLGCSFINPNTGQLENIFLTGNIPYYILLEPEIDSYSIRWDQNVEKIYFTIINDGWPKYLDKTNILINNKTKPDIELIIDGNSRNISNIEIGENEISGITTAPQEILYNNIKIYPISYPTVSYQPNQIGVNCEPNINDIIKIEKLPGNNVPSEITIGSGITINIDAQTLAILLNSANLTFSGGTWSVSP